MKLFRLLFSILLSTFIMLKQPLVAMDMLPPPSEATPAVAPQPAAQPVAPPAAPPVGTPEGTPPATPDAPTAPETPLLQSEQLKWPDTIEVGEDMQGLVQTNNPKIIALYKQAEKATNDCFKKGEEITKSCNLLSEKLEATNGQLDTFFQDITYQKGKIEETFTPRNQQAEKTPQPLTNKK